MKSGRSEYVCQHEWLFNSDVSSSCSDNGALVVVVVVFVVVVAVDIVVVRCLWNRLAMSTSVSMNGRSTPTLSTWLSTLLLGGLR